MWPRSAVALLACLGIYPPAAQAQVLVHADGRREAAANPRQDSKGRWMATVEGRRVVVKPGDVVAILHENGKETVIIPTLSKDPITPEAKAVLASLRDTRNAAWREALSRLAAQPSQAVLDDLVALAAERKKELRSRAIEALVGLRTKESVLAAAKAILGEKDRSLHRSAASRLFAVQEIFKRSDRGELVRAGIGDRDRTVRYVFAMLSPPDMEKANAVLRKESLKDRDHHVRESAAMELGLRGDRSGERVLIRMLARKKLPGFHDDEKLMIRYLIREQVAICKILGRFGTDAAKAALQKATSSPHASVSGAARAALESGK